MFNNYQPNYYHKDISEPSIGTTKFCKKVPLIVMYYSHKVEYRKIGTTDVRIVVETNEKVSNATTLLHFRG